MQGALITRLKWFQNYTKLSREQRKVVANLRVLYRKQFRSFPVSGEFVEVCDVNFRF